MTLLVDRRPSPVPDVRDDATRREFIVGGLAAGLLVAAGCGVDESETVAPPTTEGTAAFPVNIEHEFGSTQIPAEPKRVLSLGYTDQDAILALGVTPVAVRYFTGDESDAIFPWAEDEADGADPEVLNMAFGELNYERIAALGPDLIVALNSGITQEEYDTLAQIKRRQPSRRGLHLLGLRGSHRAGRDRRRRVLRHDKRRAAGPSSTPTSSSGNSSARRDEP